MTDDVSRATILVVDDEPPLLRLIARVLEKDGHTALTARNGTEAIEVFDAHRDQIEVAVLDIVIPPHGVGEVIDHLLAARDDLPLILSSGDVPGPEIAARIADHDGAAFLRKPFLPRTLLETVARSLTGAAGSSAGKAAALEVGGS